jgi:hypothetical protein
MPYAKLKIVRPVRKPPLMAWPIVCSALVDGLALPVATATQVSPVQDFVSALALTLVYASMKYAVGDRPPHALQAIE